MLLVSLIYLSMTIPGSNYITVVEVIWYPVSTQVRLFTLRGINATKSFVPILHVRKQKIKVLKRLQIEIKAFNHIFSSWGRLPS